jgi:KGK domain
MQIIPVTKQYEIVTYDSVILLTQPQKKSFVIQNIFNPIEFARLLGEPYSGSDIRKWMQQSLRCMVLSPSKNWRNGKVVLSLVLYPQEIELSGDDLAIVLTEKTNNNIGEKLSFFSPYKFKEIIDDQYHPEIYSWLRKGFNCRVLIPGKEWQYGSIKLSFVFYPDEIISDHIESVIEFSLDEIRKTMSEVN